MNTLTEYVDVVILLPISSKDTLVLEMYVTVWTLVVKTAYWHDVVYSVRVCQSGHYLLMSYTIRGTMREINDTILHYIIIIILLILYILIISNRVTLAV